MKIFWIGLFLGSVFILVPVQSVYAVVPSPTSFETDTKSEIGRQRLVDLVEEMRHREQENIHFLDELKKELEAETLKKEDGSSLKTADKSMESGQKMVWIGFAFLFLVAAYLLSLFLHDKFFDKEYKE